MMVRLCHHEIADSVPFQPMLLVVRVEYEPNLQHSVIMISLMASGIPRLVDSTELEPSGGHDAAFGSIWRMVHNTPLGVRRVTVIEQFAESRRHPPPAFQ